MGGQSASQRRGTPEAVMNQRLALSGVLVTILIGLSGCAPAATPQAGSPASGENLADLVGQAKAAYTLSSGAINELGLDIQNTTDQPLQIEVPAGTYFVNKDPAFQNMVVLQPASLSVPANGKAEVVLAVACASLHRNEPTKENSFVIQAAPQPPELAALISKLNSAGVEFPVEQAAVWIVTDNATYDELGMLVKDSRFGASIIDEAEAARAMMLVDAAGLDIKQYAIWADRYQLLGKVTDPEVGAWLSDQLATQSVLDATQSIAGATQSVLDATKVADEATQAAQTETQMALQATQTSQVGTQESQQTQTAESCPTTSNGEICQFATGAKASSEYSSTRWSAMQATGAPDTPTCGDNATAWASAASTGKDWLQLTYDTAVIPTRIVIYETDNPGAVTRVIVENAAGDDTTVYKADPTKTSQCPNRLVIEVTGVSTPVRALRITIEHQGWSEIDAVQLIGTAP
jgi:hypothetical protein